MFDRPIENRSKYILKRYKNSESTILYFPGDIQDDKQNMHLFSGKFYFRKYSYQKTILILHKKFPSSNICIIRPQVIYNLFSVYKNFFKCNDTGSLYEYDHNGFASYSLYLIMKKFIEIDNICHSYILLGFSRGCYVLNQLLCETGYSSYSKYLFEHISQIIFLDGGNKNQSDPFLELTNKNLSFLKESIKSMPLHISIHGTPYFWDYSDDINDKLFRSLEDNKVEIHSNIDTSHIRMPYEIDNLKNRNTLVNVLSSIDIECKVQYYLEEFKSTKGTDLDKHLSVLFYFDSNCC